MVGLMRARTRSPTRAPAIASAGRFLEPRGIDFVHDALQVDGCLDLLEVPGERVADFNALRALAPHDI